jgi:hypothetical protein
MATNKRKPESTLVDDVALVRANALILARMADGMIDATKGASPTRLSIGAWALLMREEVAHIEASIARVAARADA